MAIHSLPQLVCCFVFSFLFFNVSFVLALPVSIDEGIETFPVASTPLLGQPTPAPPAQLTPQLVQSPPPPAQLTPPPAQSAPPAVQPTPPPVPPTPPPAQPTPLPASAFMPAQTSAPPAPPVSPPSASPTPAPKIAPPALAPAPADQKFMGGVASGVRSDVLGLPVHSPGCITTECVAFYPSVDVFYWPRAHPNTALLRIPLTSILPRISPSIYVVYPPATVYDLCGNTADPGLRPPTTESYAPDALQTLQANPPGAPLTQVFNYADLPCPPPSIATQLDPGAAYNPVLVAPFSIVHRIENTNDTLNCNVNAIRDPPSWVVGVHGINGPHVGPQ